MQVLGAILGLCCLAAGQTRPASASAPAPRPAVVVLPFAVDSAQSASDERDVEDFGQKVAFAIAKKWRTIPGWEVIDRFTTADAMRAAGLGRGTGVDRARLAEFVRGRLKADVAVAGTTSGTGPAKTIRVRVVDYRPAAGVWPGKVVLSKTYKMDYWTDLRFILEEAISTVTGHKFAHPSETLAVLDPASLAAWKANPNLVPNGNFAQGRAGRLSRWDAVIESHRYSPPWADVAEAPIQQDRRRMVLWSPAPDDPGVKVLQFAMPSSVAASHGLACYSDWIAVQAGRRYRCAITYASEGPVFLPFVKGYALVHSPGEPGPQRREVFRRQFPKLKSTGGKWSTAVVDFVPSVLPPKGGHRRPYRLQWVRVDLYCYGRRGRLWVRDVAVKLVSGRDRHHKVEHRTKGLPPEPPGLGR